MELPPEVWDHILNYLEVNSLYNLSITCNKLNQIIINKRKELHEKLYIQEKVTGFILATNNKGSIKYLPSGKIISGYFCPFQVIEPLIYSGDGYIKVQTCEENIFFGITGNSNIINSIIIEETHREIVLTRTEYSFINGWISGCKYIDRDKCLTEHINYDRGIPLLNQDQQTKYLYDHMQYKPQIGKDGFLIVDSYINGNNEKMVRIYKDIFIGVRSMQYPDKDGFIETKRVKVKANDLGCRFLFDKFNCSEAFILNINKILSRLKMSHLWVFIKSYN